MMIGTLEVSRKCNLCFDQSFVIAFAFVVNNQVRNALSLLNFDPMRMRAQNFGTKIELKMSDFFSDRFSPRICSVNTVIPKLAAFSMV